MAGLADINPPDITPPVRIPVSVPRLDETPGHNPCRIRTQCTMSFSVTGKGVVKAKFQDWRTQTPGHVTVGLNRGVMSGGFTSANPEI